MINSAYIIVMAAVSTILISCSTHKPTAIELGSQQIKNTLSDHQANIEFLQESDIQLAKPKLMIDSILFKESASVSIDLDLEEALISYTINGGSQQIYTEPFYITETAIIEIVAEKSGYKSSRISDINVIKIANQAPSTTVVLSQEPSESYPGNGGQSLMDLTKGTLNFKQGNQWLGFQNNETEISIGYKNPLKLNTVYCSLLMDHGAWIFLPQEIQIWSDNKMISNKIIAQVEDQHDAALKIIAIDIPEGSYSDLKLKIINLDKIPEWHPGTGTPPWLFIDEIIAL